jgi:hypothetical protein
MQQVIASWPLVRSFGLCALAIIILFALWKLQAWIVLHHRRAKIINEHGCQEPPKFPNIDPILGIDGLWRNYRNFKNHTMLPEWISRFQKSGNTYSILMAGHRRISTIEPENLKAILSTHFTSYIFPPRRTEVLKAFLGESM